MQQKLRLLRLLSLSALGVLALSGCHPIKDADPSNLPDPLCSKIKQRLAGSGTENIPSYRTVTETERSQLLQEYQELGCHDSGDDPAEAD